MRQQGGGFQRTKQLITRMSVRYIQFCTVMLNLPGELADKKQIFSNAHNARASMRAFAVLGLVAAAQGSNLLYPKGCSDASKANYWPDNPDSEAACLPQATVYCPDPLADNYDAASRKLRPRTSRIPCPPCQPPLPSPARRASAHRLLAHWLVHTRARQTPGAAASTACPPTAAGGPAPAPASATSPPIRLPGLAQTTVPQPTAAQLTEPHAPFLRGSFLERFHQ